MAQTKERGAVDMTPENVRFKKKAQVTIPYDFVQELNLKEGDNLECRLENGKIVIVPVVSIPKDQAWFWSEEWQEGEREAEEDIKAGRVHSFDDAEEAVEWLNRKR